MSDGVNGVRFNESEYGPSIRVAGVSVDSDGVDRSPVVYALGSLKFWALGDRVIIQERRVRDGQHAGERFGHDSPSRV